MNLIEISLKRPVFAWILMAAMIIFGAISLNKLGVSQMPDVNFPILNINISYPGAAPEVVESEIIDSTEQRLLSVEGIKEMRSSASQGSASITLEFEINRNIDVALQEVQTALSQLRLPAGVDPAIIRKTNPEEEPILRISIFGDRDIKENIRWTQDSLLDQLQFIPGVGEVSTGGFPDRNLRVWLDAKKLKSLDLSVTDVIEAVRSQHLESAAGQFVDEKREIRVRYLGEAKTVEEIANFPIQRRGGQLIQEKAFHIKDVALVEDSFADVRRVARVDGKPAVTIEIKKQRGTNEVEVANAVMKKLDQIKYPEGLRYRVNVNNTNATKATVDLTIEKLWAASIITILVCFLFLGSFRSSINILFSIPTSILGTFIVLYFSGFTLNLFTLLALTLSISIVVDDAIMILENIVRHHRMGKTAYEAALDGSKEVLPAAIAASLAVLAVFLP
ncbi:MAG: efflux RND transporter permease subunit, partial [Bdellovibrionaceae bacterium]|nr:efflux RND transporter permease subunit [Bdellovibrio sp.]